MFLDVDKVYKRLTGEKGYFDTRIIYVSEKGPKTKRIKITQAGQKVITDYINSAYL